MEKEISSFVFGKYAQNRDGSVAPIEWKVLKKTEGNKALLISKKVLDVSCFDKQTNVWKSSSVRKWLNKNFLNSAFSEKEKTAILDTALEDVGTTDKVFLLSCKEAETLFDGRESLKDTSMTDLCKEHVPRLFAWWLRSPDEFSDSCAGAIGSHGWEFFITVRACLNGVRPVIWVDLDRIRENSWSDGLYA